MSGTKTDVKVATSQVEYGSDLLIQLMGDAGVECVTFNPGFSVKGILESLVNTTGAPKAVMCPHEGVAVAAAHAYAKATGKPMAVVLHNIVGLQHGTMAIFNAWCDRVPMLIVGGTGPLSKVEKRPWIDWIHSSNDQGALIRDYIKFDDQPVDVASLPEAFWRAWQTTCAVPEGPVYLCLDMAVQDGDATTVDAKIWRGLSNCPTAPSLDSSSAKLIAQSLAAAKFPVLITDYAGETEGGFAALRELAELLKSPVIDCGARFNFPTDHPLNFTFLEETALAQADLVLVLDAEDRDGRALPAIRPHSQVLWVVRHICVCGHGLRTISRFLVLLINLTSATEPALKAILHNLRELGIDSSKLESRQKFTDGKVAAARARWLQQAKAATAPDRIPVSALAAALNKILAGKPWTLVSGSLKGWEKKLWSFEKHRAHLGGDGGGGCGYIPGAAIGGALGIKDKQLLVSIVPDGDLLFCPAALWTIANQNIPLLLIMHNNRAYENTYEHGKRLSRKRKRPISNAAVGNMFEEPMVDFAAMAGSYGIKGFGPVTSAADLDGVLQAALKVVESGKPAVVDVITALGDLPA